MSTSHAKLFIFDQPDDNDVLDKRERFTRLVRSPFDKDLLRGLSEREQIDVWRFWFTYVHVYPTTVFDQIKRYSYYPAVNEALRDIRVQFVGDLASESANECSYIDVWWKTPDDLDTPIACVIIPKTPRGPIGSRRAQLAERALGKGDPKTILSYLLIGTLSPVKGTMLNVAKSRHTFPGDPRLSQASVRVAEFLEHGWVDEGTQHTSIVSTLFEAMREKDVFDVRISRALLAVENGGRAIRARIEVVTHFKGGGNHQRNLPECARLLASLQPVRARRPIPLSHKPLVFRHKLFATNIDACNRCAEHPMTLVPSSRTVTPSSSGGERIARHVPPPPPPASSSPLLTDGLLEEWVPGVAWQPAGFTGALLPHQMHAVNWMVRREMTPFSLNQWFGYEYVLSDGTTITLPTMGIQNSRTVFFAPSAGLGDEIRGGVLAEPTGLGKTVITIATMLERGFRGTEPPPLPPQLSSGARKRKCKTDEQQQPEKMRLALPDAAYIVWDDGDDVRGGLLVLPTVSVRFDVSDSWNEFYELLYVMLSSTTPRVTGVRLLTRIDDEHDMSTTGHPATILQTVSAIAVDRANGMPAWTIPVVNERPNPRKISSSSAAAAVPSPSSSSSSSAAASLPQGSIITLPTNDDPVGGTLIVCPVSIIEQWTNDIAKFTHGVTVHKYHGRSRVTNPRRLAQYDVVVTSYSTLAAEKQRKDRYNPLQCMRWHRLVFDEAHLHLGVHTDAQKELLELRAPFRWALTATPFPTNAVSDVIHLFRMLGVENRFLNSRFSGIDGLLLDRFGILPALFFRHDRSVVSLPEQEEKVITFALQSDAEMLYRSFEAHVVQRLRAIYSLPRHKQRRRYAYVRSCLLEPLRAASMHISLLFSESCLRSMRQILEATANSDAFAPTLELLRHIDADKALRDRVQKGFEMWSARIEDSCAICSDDMDYNTIALTACDHVFCGECLQQWMEQCNRRGARVTCPTCRTVINDPRKIVRLRGTPALPAARAPVGSVAQALARGGAPLLEEEDRYEKEKKKEKEKEKEKEEKEKEEGKEENEYVNEGGNVLWFLPAGLLLDKREDDYDAKNPFVGVSNHVVAEWVRSLRKPENEDLFNALVKHCEYPIRAGNARLNRLLSTLQSDIPDDCKAVVFAQSTRAVRLITAFLESHNVRCTSLHGQHSQRQRARTLQEFQDDSNVDVMVVSARAAAVGLNLTAANYIIVAEPFVQSAARKQGVGRVHRIGQRKKTFVYDLIAKKTIDERIYARTAALEQKEVDVEKANERKATKPTLLFDQMVEFISNTDELELGAAK